MIISKNNSKECFSLVYKELVKIILSYSWRLRYTYIYCLHKWILSYTNKQYLANCNN